MSSEAGDLGVNHSQRVSMGLNRCHPEQENSWPKMAAAAPPSSAPCSSFINLSSFSRPEFSLTAWLRARDVLAEEDAVKGGGQKYLPRLDSQTEEEFAS